MENFVHLIFTSFNDILMCVENTNRKTTFHPHSPSIVPFSANPSFAALPVGKKESGVLKREL